MWSDGGPQFTNETIYWLPTIQKPGKFQGAVTSTYIAAVSAEGIIYDAGITILDMKVPIFNE